MTQVLDTLKAQTLVRYPNAAENAEIQSFAQSIPERLQALREIEAKEAVLAQAAAQWMLQNYPNMRAYPDAESKTIRDVVYILRHCAQAMLRNDTLFLRNKLLYWLKTILDSFGFEKGLLVGTYRELDAICRRELQAPHYALLAPSLKALIEEMS
jgi:hypothetical protein